MLAKISNRSKRPSREEHRHLKTYDHWQHANATTSADCWLLYNAAAGSFPHQRDQAAKQNQQRETGFGHNCTLRVVLSACRIVTE
jgi:hypothetical protein